MAVVPESRVQQIEFYEAHLTQWAANAVAIGLTAAQVTQLNELTTTARGAFTDSKEARIASLGATQTFYDDTDAMHKLGSDLIRTIKNKAESTDDPNVYVLAGIPAPAQPSPTPPPGSPTDFRIELQQSGVLKLTWKCANPGNVGGTQYEVQRRSGASGAFAFIGSSGTRSFVDDTLPAGAAQATYGITATRSTARGVPAYFTVNFGVNPGGGAFIAGVDGDASIVSAAEAAAPSTVDGRIVRKTLPGGNGNVQRTRA